MFTKDGKRNDLYRGKNDEYEEFWIFWDNLFYKKINEFDELHSLFGEN